MNSVDEKAEDRLREASDEYYTFINDYPEGKYSKEVNRLNERIQKKLAAYID